MATIEEYWTKRAELLEARWNRDAQVIEKELKTSYRQALKEAENEMRAYLTRKGFDYNELMKSLNRSEIKDRKESLLNFLDKLKDMDTEISKRIAEDVNVHLDKRKLSRLDAIISEMLIQTGEYSLKDEQMIRDQLKEVYRETLFRNKFELAGLGINTPVYTLNNKIVDKVLSYPWNGENFSNRIWNNKQVMLQKLREALVQGVLQGLHADEVAEKFAVIMTVPLHRAQATVYTETAFIYGQAQLDSYDEAEIDKYKLHVTFDNVTSKICRALDASKIYLASEARAGINYPPLHTRCRTLSIPYFEGIEGAKYRWVRDKNGNSVKVDNANMSYKEYKEQFLK
ncbi:phage head morphogenesis protein [Bacillus cereus]|uniref:minor capsid protein n=1 Tax=Bacillus cereus group TaxID=86661 RepID=UPI000BECB89B|nr:MULTISPECIES: minor capsid protein [Bacillus cereus group]PDZ39163.1 phage head morphogenesis protein [Bacillus cereus]PET38165.1 phage head morphogenesis protein [Bacillus cereus]PFA19762.1 phage head morphogenesis protein [Bacillus cereus]PFL04976.1 phage head morphogenesis protein [Bacillus thuringiensis]PFS75806.1 phage head morphogenesis protein [Bacillus cereus]